ncbi:RrF2 family transcriptional regulator [Brevundimonas faecalis]|uniref:Rrf2 family protein n=1 Tax=Brevundimonas faecalis TaxID=947378 RepID=A0ABV2R862_9CAUL
MKLSEGVEQAIHCVAMLSQLSEDGVLSAAALAEFHGVKTSYLLKHLQALSGAGVLRTLPGPKGGYRLARAPQSISLLDILLAVEGPEPAFRCQEIRQRGPNPLPVKPRGPCQINAAMLRAEQSYRAELRRTSIADVLTEVAAKDEDGAIEARGCAFLAVHERRQGG